MSDPLADLGVLMAAGVSVGLYPTSAPAQVAQVLADSGATVLVTREHLLDALPEFAGEVVLEINTRRCTTRGPLHTFA